MNRTGVLLAAAAGCSLFALVVGPPVAGSPAPLPSPSRPFAVVPKSNGPDAAVAGLYFLGGRRVMMLDAERAALREYRPAPTSLQASYSAASGQLGMFGVKLSTSCTYGVLDGHLHFGVLVPSVDNGQIWTSAPCDLALLPDGLRERWPWNDPSVRIFFNRSKDTWTFSSSAQPQLVMKARLLRNPDDESEFVPAFEDAMKGGSPFEPFTAADRLSFGSGDGVSWSGGLYTDPVTLATLEADEGRRREYFASRVHHGSFHDRKTFVLTPWSVDLGPANVSPLAVPQRPEGTWEDEVSGARVTVLTGVPRPERSTFPGHRDIEPDLQTHFFEPDTYGVSHELLRCDCVMGHMDVFADVFWFQLSPDRAVRYVTPGACHNAESAVGLRYFRRVD